MANWIKMRSTLEGHSKVLRMADVLSADPKFRSWMFPGLPQSDADKVFENSNARLVTAVTAASLLKVWGVTNENGDRNARDVILRHCGRREIDLMANCPGFATAMESVGWLHVDEANDCVSMPNFDSYNTIKDDRKNANAEKQRRYRERKKAEADAKNGALPNSGNAGNATVTNVTPRSEQIRTDQKEVEKTKTLIPSGSSYGQCKSDGVENGVAKNAESDVDDADQRSFTVGEIRDECENDVDKLFKKCGNPKPKDGIILWKVVALAKLFQKIPMGLVTSAGEAAMKKAERNPVGYFRDTLRESCQKKHIDLDRLIDHMHLPRGHWGKPDVAETVGEIAANAFALAQAKRDAETI